MPVVTIHYDKLVKILGREVSFEELAHNLIPMLGSDVERIDEREWLSRQSSFRTVPTCTAWRVLRGHSRDFWG